MPQHQVMRPWSISQQESYGTSSQKTRTGGVAPWDYEAGSNNQALVALFMAECHGVMLSSHCDLVEGNVEVSRSIEELKGGQN